MHRKQCNLVCLLPHSYPGVWWWQQAKQPNCPTWQEAAPVSQSCPVSWFSRDAALQTLSFIISDTRMTFSQHLMTKRDSHDLKSLTSLLICLQKLAFLHLYSQVGFTAYKISMACKCVTDQIYGYTLCSISAGWYSAWYLGHNKLLTGICGSCCAWQGAWM